jgi:hypothetical protein
MKTEMNSKFYLVSKLFTKKFLSSKGYMVVTIHFLRFLYGVDSRTESYKVFRKHFSIRKSYFIVQFHFLSLEVVGKERF